MDACLTSQKLEYVNLEKTIHEENKSSLEGQTQPENIDTMKAAGDQIMHTSDKTDENEPFRYERNQGAGDACDQNKSEAIRYKKLNEKPFEYDAKTASHNERNEIKTEYLNDEFLCGYGFCKPLCLQKAAKPYVVLLCICVLVLGQSIVASGYISSIVTTIEKQYNLQSKESGLVLSSYEFSCILAVVAVSFYGERFNRAKILGAGAVVMAVGSCLFALPHFIGNTYQSYSLKETENATNLCSSSENLDANDEGGSKHTISWAYSIFIIAQLVIGFGASPVYILGPTYLHDNCNPALFSIFSGTMYAMAALGPAIGFLLGAAFVSFYVDVPIQPPQGITEDSPQWIGAWWIGFLLVASILLIAASLLMAFPKQLPLDVKPKNMDKSEVMGFGNSIKEVPAELKKLFTNLTWLFVSLTVVCEQSVVTGFINFIAKFTQINFSVPASQANIIAGGVLVPAAALGIFCGGVMMKRFRPNVFITIKIMLGIISLSIVMGATLLFFGCETIKFAGVTEQYQNERGKFHLISSCNIECTCNKNMYEPVCDNIHEVTYFSPCHAGCQFKEVFQLSETVFQNFSSCNCLNSGVVQQGRCEQGCDKMIPFLILLFATIFVVCLGHNPALIVTLRCVGDSERSFALGMQYFLIRGLAFIPAPIYFGHLFDSQCILWERNRNEGACLEYRTGTLPYAMFGSSGGLQLLALIFLMCAYFVRKAKEKKHVAEPTDSMISFVTTPETQSKNISDIANYETNL